jgi:septation ring formation regulator EzrA
METQQMMELLLARMNASMKEHMQEMTARIDANQAKMKADRKAIQDMLARMDANIKEMNTTQERMYANLKDLREDIKSSQAEIRSSLYIPV